MSLFPDSRLYRPPFTRVGLHQRKVNDLYLYIRYGFRCKHTPKKNGVTFAIVMEGEESSISRLELNCAELSLLRLEFLICSSHILLATK